MRAVVHTRLLLCVAVCVARLCALAVWQASFHRPSSEQRKGHQDERACWAMVSDTICHSKIRKESQPPRFLTVVAHLFPGP